MILSFISIRKVPREVLKTLRTLQMLMNGKSCLIPILKGHVIKFQWQYIIVPIVKPHINEPLHDKTNKMTCAQRRLGSASDQSSLCTHWVAKDPRFLHAYSEDSDHTGRMPRLICVFAGCTDNFVGFVMRRLI